MRGQDEVVCEMIRINQLRTTKPDICLADSGETMPGSIPTCQFRGVHDSASEEPECRNCCFKSRHLLQGPTMPPAMAPIF